MTEAPARRAPKRPSAWPVAAGSLALFAVVLAFLALQLKAGRDPALGAGRPQPPKRVLVKRVEKKVVVTRVVRDDDGGDGESEGGGSGSGSSSPVTVASAPAPAPAPAPVSTQSS